MTNVKTLISEYLTIEARQNSWISERSHASDDRKSALDLAIDSAECDLELQIKAIANHTGNILSAIDAINEVAS